MAPFLEVDDNCTLARSMPVEQEPSTSSALGRLYFPGWPRREDIGWPFQTNGLLTIEEVFPMINEAFD